MRAVTAHSTDWAGAGHTVSFGQFAVGGDKVPEPEPAQAVGRSAEAVESDDTVRVGGDGFRYTFGKTARPGACGPPRPRTSTSSI
ncbi:hypothetical protein [Streptomyces malaysiensis]|uniref:hypothetical protein n=1 Tax=Streptomyces malaysiensis TaxID=92644 RepID=UPI002B2E2AAA|nr:hypothetical protein R8789_11460 [Streptomyces malaysiensis]